MCRQGQQSVMNIGGRRVDVDDCLYRLVAVLNRGGFKTVACCCGHGKHHGNIALSDGRELIIARDFNEGRKIDKLLIQEAK